MPRKLRLGIDVGGTFTDVVAIDASTREVVARVKVPTTHDAEDGVAAGIVDGIARMLDVSGLKPSDVAFIAHSTTQATNALLEGDVARVGVLGLHGGAGWFDRRAMRFPRVELAPGVPFEPAFEFAPAADAKATRAALDRLIARGVEVVAASESFAVDRPQREATVASEARERGLYATSGHDVSTMYGLRARTRTAALNAAILPRMVRTSRMTAQAVAGAAIPVPLMIMRSDGGVMDVHEIERRPILTLLSGPAAGVAGALLYDNVSDGIFIEVGGTSADCSAIVAGRPQMQPARIGGHRTMLRTVDVRTLGVGGGSMMRLRGSEVIDVGPRSAHIAGCRYAAFTSLAEFDGATLERIAPLDGDPGDYAILRTRDGARIALTPTCASNALGLMPADAFATGDAQAARAGFAIAASALGIEGEELARALLDCAAKKVAATIEVLIAEYCLDRERAIVVGGGGGAGALVPAAAQHCGLAFRIARDAEVISPIGVALALVRDTVERTLVAPAPHEIAALRREAADRVIAAGAAPDRVEVQIEIDTQTNRVRATASGATALVESAGHGALDDGERLEIAARALGCAADAVRVDQLTPLLALYRSGTAARVLDERGVVRLALAHAELTRCAGRDYDDALRRAIDAATRYGDVGRSLPALYIVSGGRIAVFEGLIDLTQTLELAREEIGERDDNEMLAFLTVPREA